MTTVSDKPLVSIVVRTKDRPKLLKRALQSVAAQTYRPIEVVLVNDGGCDLDVEELKNILGDVSLNYIRLEKNMGRAHAANVGIENTNGEYLGFLDDDDIYYPDATASLYEAVEGSNARIVYGRVLCRKYKDLDAVDGTDQEMLGMAFDPGKLVFENFIPINSLFVPRSCFYITGPLDSNFEIYEDWDYLIRLSEEYEFHFVDTLVAEYSIFGTATILGKGGISLQNHYREKLLDKHIGKANARDFLLYIQSIIDRVVLEKDKIAAEKDQIIAEKNMNINELSAVLPEREMLLAQIQEETSLKDEMIAKLRLRLDSLEESLERKQNDFEELRSHTQELERVLEGILSSKSWMLTKPFRAMGSVLGKILERL